MGPGPGSLEGSAVKDKVDAEVVEDVVVVGGGGASGGDGGTSSRDAEEEEEEDALTSDSSRKWLLGCLWCRSRIRAHNKLSQAVVSSWICLSTSFSSPCINPQALMQAYASICIV